MDDQTGKRQRKPIDRQTRIEYIDRINKFVEALAKGHFSGSEYRILMVVLRKTLLFNKDSDSIARSQFAEFTGIAEGNVSRLISKLVRRRAIISTPRGLRTRGGWVNCYSLEEDSTKWEVEKHRKIGLRVPRGINPDTFSGEKGYANEQERDIQMEQKGHPYEQEGGIKVDAHKLNTNKYTMEVQTKSTQSVTNTDPPSLEEVGSDNVINQHADKDEDKDQICRGPRTAPEGSPRLAPPAPEIIAPEKFIGDKCLEICKKGPDGFYGEDLDITFRAIRDGIAQIINTYYGVPWEELLPLLQSWTGWNRVAESPVSFKEEFENFLLIYWSEQYKTAPECLEEDEGDEGGKDYEEQEEDDCPF